MSSNYENISRAITKIGQLENDMINEEAKIKSEVESSKNWWTGQTSKSFLTKYKEDEAQIIKVHRSIPDLNAALKRLISEVDSADRERIAAEKRRLEQELNKNKQKK